MDVANFTPLEAGRSATNRGDDYKDNSTNAGYGTSRELLTGFTDPESNIRELGVYEGQTVVDLGAGTGAHTVLLAERVGESGRVYAIEVQKEFLTNIKAAAADRGFKNVEVIWGDIERLGGTKVKDEIADATVVSNVLFQAEDKGGLLREVKRILKPQGKLLIVDWKDSFGNLGPTPDAVVPAIIAQELAEKEGFVLKKAFDAGAHHYGLVLYKV